MVERLPLTELPRAMKDAGYTPITYRAAYRAALDARIPATKDKNGRWGCNAADLPKIAQAMGLSEAVAA